MMQELHKMHVNDPQDKPSLEKHDIDMTELERRTNTLTVGGDRDQGMAEMERRIKALTVRGDRDRGHKKNIKSDSKDVYVVPGRRNNNMHGNDDRSPSDTEQHEYAPHSPRHGPPQPPYRHYSDEELYSLV
jgi:hypothetical protein